MADRVLVAGAGVFGTHLARELLRRTDAHIVLAARREVRLKAAAASLGEPDRVEARILDLASADDLRRAARDCVVVACAAGPFDGFRRDLPRTAVEAGAHWVDLADEPGWVLGLLGDPSLASAARAAGLSVLPGRSTVPALSCALVAWGAARVTGAYRASITLTIGNRNTKGAGAIAAAAGGGFRNPVPVSTPLGALTAWRFDAPDVSLLAPGILADVRVALEWAPAGVMVAGANRLPRAMRAVFARVSETVGSLASRFGSEGGAIQAEVFDPRGRRAAAALVFPQRVAVAPTAHAIEALLGGDGPRTGVVSPVEWPGAIALIEDAVSSGARLLVMR
jgi:saccharopine dehydrogenase-like protein